MNKTIEIQDHIDPILTSYMHAAEKYSLALASKKGSNIIVAKLNLTIQQRKWFDKLEHDATS